MPVLGLDIKTINSAKGLEFTVQIVEQRLRGSKADFTASNGFRFASLSCPAIGIGYNVNGGGGSKQGLLYLRGSAWNDNEILCTNSVGYIEKLKAAVIEYNIAKEDVT